MIFRYVLSKEIGGGDDFFVLAPIQSQFGGRRFVVGVGRVARSEVGGK